MIHFSPNAQSFSTLKSPFGYKNRNDIKDIQILLHNIYHMEIYIDVFYIFNEYKSSIPLFIFYFVFHLDGINLNFERTMLIKRWHDRSKSEMSI